MAEHSKSLRQALFMAEQANPDLPEGVERRILPDIALRFHHNDVLAGVYFHADGRPKDPDQP